MKCFTSYQRLNSDTVSGETLVVSMRYTTFDTSEMDRLEEGFRKSIGSGVMTEEFNVKELGVCDERL